MLKGWLRADQGPVVHCDLDRKVCRGLRILEGVGGEELEIRSINNSFEEVQW